MSVYEGNQLLTLINRLRAAFIGRDEGLRGGVPEYTNALTQTFVVNTWYTLIASNTLAYDAIYMIELKLTAGSEPWSMGAVALIRPINTNYAGGFDNGFALLTSTHTANYGATPSQFEMRYKTAAGAIAPEIQIRITGATGAPAGSLLTVNARRMV